MSAVDRLAAAMFDGLDMDDAREGARLMVTADATLAQDIEDGRAIRELRAALPEGWAAGVVWDPFLRDGCEAEVFVSDGTGPGGISRKASAPTIAEAVDACRAALAAR